MKLYNPFKNWYNPFTPHILHTVDNRYILRAYSIGILGFRVYDFHDKEWYSGIYFGSYCNTEAELREKYKAAIKKPKETVIKL